MEWVWTPSPTLEDAGATFACTLPLGYGPPTVRVRAAPVSPPVRHPRTPASDFVPLSSRSQPMNFDQRHCYQAQTPAACVTFIQVREPEALNCWLHVTPATSPSRTGRPRARGLQRRRGRRCRRRFDQGDVLLGGLSWLGRLCNRWRRLCIRERPRGVPVVRQTYPLCQPRHGHARNQPVLLVPWRLRRRAPGVRVPSFALRRHHALRVCPALVLERLLHVSPRAQGLRS